MVSSMFIGGEIPLDSVTEIASCHTKLLKHIRWNPMKYDEIMLNTQKIPEQHHIMTHIHETPVIVPHSKNLLKTHLCLTCGCFGSPCLWKLGWLTPKNGDGHQSTNRGWYTHYNLSISIYNLLLYIRNHVYSNGRSCIL